MTKKEQKDFPQTCEYCAYFLEYKLYYACAKTNMFKFILFGPEKVSFDSWCNRFKYAKKYKSDQNTR